MRKKSKKKQIVAMTLALSVLSSSVGMCGASAAEALSDTDDSGLQVTIVPLADNTETPPRPPRARPRRRRRRPLPRTTSLPLPPATAPTSPPTARATVTIPLLTTNPPSSARSSPTPSRPCPAPPRTTRTTSRARDKDDAEDKGDSGEETPAPAILTPATRRKRARKVPALRETPEEKPEETPKEDDTDYSCAYDPKSGHFKVTFNIKEDAEGDQTIELSKVQEVVNAYGKQAVEEYLQTDEAKEKYDNYLYYGMTFTCTLPNGAQFILRSQHRRSTPLRRARLRHGV